MNLTVLIPTHGRPTLLKRTLESLKACTLPDSYHELVVIENGSRDGAEEVVANLPDRLNARYMHESWGNKSNALNAALETIEDGLVVFFDDDVRVSEQVLTAYAEAAEEHPKTSYFGGTVRVDRETDPPTWAEKRFPASVRGYELVGKERNANWYLGFNWAVHRSILRKNGGFDTSLGPGTESGLGDESELHARLWEDGATPVDVPEAVVWHHVPSQNTTILWLLSREYKRGIASAQIDNKKTRGVISSMLISTLVLSREALLFNKYEMLAAVLNICFQAGCFKAKRLL